MDMSEQRWLPSWSLRRLHLARTITRGQESFVVSACRGQRINERRNIPDTFEAPRCKLCERIAAKEATS